MINAENTLHSKEDRCIFQIAVKSSQIYSKPILHTGNLRFKFKIKITMSSKLEGIRY